MTTTLESASQAGQRVGNGKTSFLGETLDPEWPDLDMKQLARTLKERIEVQPTDGDTSTLVGGS